MSSELESAVSSIVENNYVTLVILTAVGYDYILTLADEIEYVWNKPWTRVSTLFVFIRYFGLCIVIWEYFPTWLCKGQVLFIIAEWATCAFLGAADLAMILRVWTIYMRSRIVLGVLLTLYIVEIAPFLVGCIILSAKLLADTAQVLDFSFCVVETGISTLAEVNDYLQFALAAVMFLLVANKFIQHSLEMYKVTKQWQPSRYMNLFARESMLYFLAILLFALLDILTLEANIPTTGWQALLVGVFEYVPVLTLAPRFILSVRALYARDLRHRCEPCSMDSDFGFTSVPGNKAGGAAIMLTNMGQNDKDGLEQQQEIPTEEGEMRGAGSGV